MTPTPSPRVTAARAPQKRLLPRRWARLLPLGLLVVVVGVFILMGALGAYGVGGQPDRGGPARFMASGSVGTLEDAPGERPHPLWCTGPIVAGEVIDGFRPPPHPWSAGNRGWTIATEAGDPVRAATDGVVTFAGPVAHRLYVTVVHPGDLRTSYSYLTRIEVNKGDVVARGQVLGTSGPVFHLGLRDGDTYLDPALLTRWRCPWRAVLVPLDGAAATPHRPRSAGGRPTPRH